MSNHFHAGVKACRGREARVRMEHRKYARTVAQCHRVEWAVLCDDVLCDDMCPRGTKFRLRANGAVLATRENG